MPRRNDIHRILLIGSGPIVIGQAAEFDYSGTQASRALREEGYEVILVNSNPATIMTDPEVADRTYLEPVTPEYVEMVIAKERPDALLPTMGGQTALNVAMKLSENGVLEKYGVELIGAKARAIKVAEDREEFGYAMERIGLKVPQGRIARTWEEAQAVAEFTGYPAIIRPSFTLGGAGGGIYQTGGAAFGVGDSVVAANTVGGGGGFEQCSGSFTSATGLVLENQTGGACAFSGTPVATSDPMIGSLAPNGGPTETVSLLPESPAIGVAATCPKRDQRGKLRPGNCDSGSFEENPR